MRALLLPAAFILPVLAHGPAGAQVPLAGPGPRLPCHDYGEIARQLAERYKEAPVSAGLQANGHLLQVFHSAETGTWTILSTAPGGPTCIVAAGKSWQSIAPPSTDPEA